MPGKYMHNRSRALLITAFLLPGIEANAQARGPTVTEIEEEAARDGVGSGTPPATADDLEAWLRRLTGRFKLSHGANAQFTPSPEKLVDCVAVGSGPGVQCLLGIPNTDRAMPVLLGLDRVSLSISYMATNDKGIAEYAIGRLKGATVTFHAIRCNIDEESRQRWVTACDRKLFIWAPVNGKEVQYTSVTDTRLRLSGGTVEGPTIIYYQWLKRVVE